MAITKIHSIKTTLKKSLNYITDKDKTDEDLLVYGYNVDTDPNTATTEFELTVKQAKQVKGDYTKVGKSNILAYHLIQSFSPTDNIKHDKAHEIGKKFATEFLENKYEYVLSTHIDKGHIHNHIIFNATSFETHKKFESVPYKTVKKIRDISDKYCKENNLSVIETKENNKSNSYKEWDSKKNNSSWKEQIKNIIDNAISNKSVKNFEDFKKYLRENKVTIKEGKHISFNLAGQERFTRGKTIGENYTLEMILARIENRLNNKEVETNFESKELQSSFYYEVESNINKSTLEKTRELETLLLNIRNYKLTSEDDITNKLTSMNKQIYNIKNNLKNIENLLEKSNKKLEYIKVASKYSYAKEAVEKSNMFNKKKNLSKYESELMLYDNAKQNINKLENEGITCLNSDDLINYKNELEQINKSLKTSENKYDNLKKSYIVYKELLKSLDDNQLNKEQIKQKDNDIEK